MYTPMHASNPFLSIEMQNFYYISARPAKPELDWGKTEKMKNFGC